MSESIVCTDTEEKMMYLIGKPRAFAALNLLFLFPMFAHGATLSVTPPPSVVSGETYLASPAVFAMPFNLPTGSFWAPNVLEWNTAEEISVQISVSQDPSPTDTAAIVFTVVNINAGEWSGFEIDVSGPAQFITDAPSESSRAFASNTIDENQITFSGFDWPEGTDLAPTSTTLSFSVVLTPQGPDESMILTFRPIAVPEPTSGLLLGGSAAIVITRRRRNK